MVIRSLFLLLVMALGACAQNPVSFDYDTAASLPVMKTYALSAPAGGGGQFQSLDNNRIEAALRKQLGSRGLQEVATEKADFLVAYRIDQERKLEESGVSYGFGFGTGNVGMGISTGPKAKEIIEGKLIVDVVDPARKQVVWTAKANRYLRDSMSPDERGALINSLVDAMMTQFPTGKK